MVNPVVAIHFELTNCAIYFRSTHEIMQYQCGRHLDLKVFISAQPSSCITENIPQYRSLVGHTLDNPPSGLQPVEIRIVPFIESRHIRVLLRKVFFLSVSSFQSHNVATCDSFETVFAVTCAVTVWDML